MTYGVLKTINASNNDPSHLAFDFENNSRVNGGKLYIKDDQINPTGNTVKAHGEQSGNLGTVDDGIENGEVLIEIPPA